jgi:hypothetical protein
VARLWRFLPRHRREPAERKADCRSSRRRGPRAPEPYRSEAQQRSPTQRPFGAIPSRASASQAPLHHSARRVAYGTRTRARVRLGGVTLGLHLTWIYSLGHFRVWTNSSTPRSRRDRRLPCPTAFAHLPRARSKSSTSLTAE